MSLRKVKECTITKPNRNKMQFLKIKKKGDKIHMVHIGQIKSKYYLNTSVIIFYSIK